MIDNFVFSLNVVVPVFAVMFLGYALKKREVITARFLTSGNKIVYYIGLPALLFRGVYQAGELELDARFIAFSLLTQVAAFLIIWGLSAIFLKEKPVWAAFSQGAYRGSFALLGTPLILNMAGAAGMARAALVVVFVVPFFNVFSILALAVCAEKKPSTGKIAITVLTNPSNIMIAFAIILTVFDISLPTMVRESIMSVANVATPLALLCLGGGMAFRGFDAKFKYALIGSIIKVVAMPAIFTALAIAFGFRDYDLAIILILFGVPSAVVGYAMAAQMGGDTYVAGTIVVISTVMSAATLTVFIYTLRVLGLLNI